MSCFCCDPRRKSAVEASSEWNGIDYLEVIDNEEDPISERQTTLLVSFIHNLESESLTAANVRIEGGERIRSIRILNIEIAPELIPPGSPTGAVASVQSKLLRVKVAAPGDFSFYRLILVDALDDTRPPVGFDRLLASIEFSFKAACDSAFDCADNSSCPTPPVTTPPLNYLARDFTTFRRLMLDRMAHTVPAWQERNAADLGMVLTELLAYVSDRLAYEQDALATESYLGTARLRTSVRRHARLVDYAMHDGCNARTFVQLKASEGTSGLTIHRSYLDQRTQLFTRSDHSAPVVTLGSEAHRQALTASTQVFELLHDITVFDTHNRMTFYTWGARACCLPAGSQAATLCDHRTSLMVGDILILLEERSAISGLPEDSDKSHRHAVKLTRVSLTEDPLGGKFATPEHRDPVPVTEIEWHSSDALPFALTISSQSGTAYIEDVSVACGNIVAVDHGMTYQEDALAPVPSANPVLRRVQQESQHPCSKTQPLTVPVRFRPQLDATPITQACPFLQGQFPSAAAEYLAQRPADTVAQITLREEGESEYWIAQRDLLGSTSGDRHFVLEAEHDGHSRLRFGDDIFGMRPAEGTRLHAIYRVGNGTDGNLGESSLCHLASAEPAVVATTPRSPIEGVWNPLPARGGVEAESIESVRQRAPNAFRVNERAVTPEDYERRVLQVDDTVQRAGATLRWTGSWRTLFLTTDRFGCAEVDDDFENNLLAALEPYRLAGHDLEVDGPHYVPLELALKVCVQSDHFRADIESAIVSILGTHLMPDGTPGVFHPDNFSFGKTVYLSPIQAMLLGIDGVESVVVTRFRRQGQPGTEASRRGYLSFNRLEIPRLDNDPNFPDHGALELTLGGGR